MDVHLLTKLRPSTTHSDLIRREPLYRQLDRAMRSKLTLISAPAGYGKTTLLAQWTKIQTTPVSWLILDQEDNSPSRFLHYFLTALENAGISALAFPENSASNINETFIALLNALTLSSTSATVILDNYHLISNETLHAGIEFLLNHAPPQFHLVISTRFAPPFPLSRWRARNYLSEIRPREMRYTQQEVETYCQSRFEIPLPFPTIQKIAQHTEGWPAGVELYTRILTTNRDAQINGAHPYFSDYFQEEVFVSLPSPTQQFLLQTAPLRALNTHLCAAITTNNLPLTSELFLNSSVEGDEWHYLPLFKEFLLSHPLRNTDQDRELHRQARHWSEHNNRMEDAIFYAFGSGDVDEAARLIAAIAPSLLQSGHWTNLRRWLDQLPEEYVWSHPRLCITRIWLLLETYHQQAIQPYLERLDTFLADNPPTGLQSELLSIRAVIAAMRLKPELALELASQAESLWTDGDPMTGAHVAFSLGAAYKMGTDPVRAEHWFRQTSALAEASGSAYLAFAASENLSDMCLYQARLFEAATHARRALNHATIQGLEAPYSGWIHCILGMIALAWNELSAAHREANRCIEQCQQWGNTAILTRGLFLLIQIHQTRGEFISAYEILENADTIARQTGDSRLLRAVTRYRVLLALAERNIDSARKWWDILSREPAPGPEIQHHLVAARLYLSEGQPRHALPCLLEAERLVAEAGMAFFEIEVLVLRALTYRALGQAEHATAALSRAIKIGEQGKLRRVFTEAGAPIKELLRRVVVDSPQTVYIGELLKSFEENAGETGYDALTGREFQILRLLATGFTNRDIADELVIAESTLKRHIANLYLKLGVHSRTQAIARAQDTQLI